jgi:hypothetical protein
MITRSELERLYIQEGASMLDISKKLNCSVNRVVYWMSKHDIQRRSISDAIYLRANPKGDPFKMKEITTLKDAQLFGMGMGLYWGEGTKANKHSVRLGNTDPELLRTFISFLVEICGVEKNKLKFGLQIFTDISPEEALDYWLQTLELNKSQFYKIHITISGSIGTYKRKSKYGVVTIYFHNKKLRDIMIGLLPR